MPERRPADLDRPRLDDDPVDIRGACAGRVNADPTSYDAAARPVENDAGATPVCDRQGETTEVDTAAGDESIGQLPGPSGLDLRWPAGHPTGLCSPVDRQILGRGHAGRHGDRVWCRTGIRTRSCPHRHWRTQTSPRREGSRTDVVRVRHKEFGGDREDEENSVVVWTAFDAVTVIRSPATAARPDLVKLRADPRSPNRDRSPPRRTRTDRAYRPGDLKKSISAAAEGGSACANDLDAVRLDCAGHMPRDR